MQPKLSVIVPVYRVEPYLCECLDSIVNQTFKSIEVICIDDGSPDKCGEICDEYAKDIWGGVIVKVFHRRNQGSLSARNDGIQLATGEYLTFVDSDDWIDLDYYERMFSVLGQRTADVFCSGGRYIERNRKTEIVKTLDRPFICENKNYRTEMMARTLVNWPTGKKGEFLCNLGYVWDKIYRTSFIKEKMMGWNKRINYGPWDDALFELCIFSRAAWIGGCLEIGYHYRQSASGTATNKYWENLPEICYNCADDIYKFLEKDSAFEELVLKDAFIARCQMMFLATETLYFTHSQNKELYWKKAKIYQDFKKKKYFKEAFYRNTPFRTDRSFVKLSLMRWTGLWFLYVIKWIRSLQKNENI